MRLLDRATLFLARRLCIVGSQCQAAEDHTHAVFAYQLALRLNPDCDEAQANLARLLFDVGNIEGLTSLVAAWLDRHPVDYQSHLGMARLHVLGLQFEKAERHLLLAAQQGAPSPNVLTIRAFLHIRQSQLEPADAAANTALAESPQHYEALVAKAQLLVAQNERPSAIATLEGAVQAHPGRVEAYVALARLGHLTSPKTSVIC